MNECMVLLFKNIQVCLDQNICGCIIGSLSNEDNAKDNA